jgi:hypothetical protein
MDLTKLKEAIKKFLPMLKLITAMTPNPWDNLVVEFLEKVLAMDDAKAAEMLAKL